MTTELKTKTLPVNTDLHVGVYAKDDAVAAITIPELGAVLYVHNEKLGKKLFSSDDRTQACVNMITQRVTLPMRNEGKSKVVGDILIMSGFASDAEPVSMDKLEGMRLAGMASVTTNHELEVLACDEAVYPAPSPEEFVGSSTPEELLAALESLFGKHCREEQKEPSTAAANDDSNHTIH